MIMQLWMHPRPKRVGDIFAKYLEIFGKYSTLMFCYYSKKMNLKAIVSYVWFETWGKTWPNVWAACLYKIAAGNECFFASKRLESFVAAICLPEKVFHQNQMFTQIFISWSFLKGHPHISPIMSLRENCWIFFVLK